MGWFTEINHTGNYHVILITTSLIAWSWWIQEIMCSNQRITLYQSVVASSCSACVTHYTSHMSLWVEFLSFSHCVWVSEWPTYASQLDLPPTDCMLHELQACTPSLLLLSIESFTSQCQLVGGWCSKSCRSEWFITVLFLMLLLLQLSAVARTSIEYKLSIIDKLLHMLAESLLPMTHRCWLGGTLLVPSSSHVSSHVSFHLLVVVTTSGWD
jgi:hypothetical protein